METTTLESNPVEIPGVNELLQKGDRCQKRKLFMLAVFVISAAFCTVACYSVSYEYYMGSTATKIYFEKVKSLLLPKLTICANRPNAYGTVRLANYVNENLANTSTATVLGFIDYMTAGSGFHFLEQYAKTVNQSSINHYDHMYQKLRTNRTVVEFFHYFFETYGLDCETLFVRCRLGHGNLKNCCQLFEPSYTVTYGKCYSLKPVDQSEPHDEGKLTLNMNISGDLLNQDNKRFYRNLMLFVTDHDTQDVMPRPLFRIYPYYYTSIRLTALRIQMHANGPSKCVRNPELFRGEGMCYLSRWLGQYHRRFNCTPPYWPEQGNPHPRACETRLTVENYDSLVYPPYLKENDTSTDIETPCQQPCERWEYSVGLEQSPTENKEKFLRSGYQFWLQVNYGSLQYNVVREVRTVTLSGFVSQIGGHMGLFLGSSIISLAQLWLFVVIVVNTALIRKLRSLLG